MKQENTWKNQLWYGDNLDVLRKFPNDYVDLIYLDPPFNSNTNYNILFGEKDGSMSIAQETAFKDSWSWDDKSSLTYKELVDCCDDVSTLMTSFHDIFHLRQGKGNDMFAYLVMMAIRLKELHRVLKPTGSLYLHCDPTASHYIKLILDSIFGFENYRNEITWLRSQTRSSISKIFRRAHDIILSYSKDIDKCIFNLQYKKLSEASKNLYTKQDDKGYYRLVPLIVSGIRNGITGKPWHGIDPNKYGRNGMHWVTTHEKLEEYEANGLMVWGKKAGTLPQLKYYLESQHYCW